MHDLTPLTPLAGTTPRTRTIGRVTLREVFDLAMASVAARKGSEADTATRLAEVLGAVAPEPGRAVLESPMGAIWMAADQWFVTGQLPQDVDLAERLQSRFAAVASVTDQTDAWVIVDIESAEAVPMLERLCPAPTRRMQAAAAQRTVLHQIGCVVVCLEAGNRYRVISPRSSAASLWHALETAARAIC